MLSLPLIQGCSHQPPVPPVDRVDLDRFMGDWYVIAAIPTPFEKNIYNAVETYERAGERKVATTFRFNKGGFDGDRKTFNPTGFVQEDTNNAVWKMQFIWPLRLDYRVIALESDYSQTVIGHRRKYAWIMARRPEIPEADYKELRQLLVQYDYPVEKLQRIPQRWDSADNATAGEGR